MADEKQEQIRQLAYQFWLEEGMPEGRAQEHWERAEKLIEDRDPRGEENTSPVSENGAGTKKARKRPEAAAADRRRNGASAKKKRDT